MLPPDLPGHAPEVGGNETGENSRPTNGEIQRPPQPGDAAQADNRNGNPHKEKCFHGVSSVSSRTNRCKFLPLGCAKPASPAADFQRIAEAADGARVAHSPA